jgi:ABC-type xylose transport system permease subunit
MTMGKRFNIVGQIPLITLAVLCVVTALLTNRFLSPLNLTNILVQSSIMAVIAIGMTFVIIGGGFDLSVGSTVALAGCIAAMTMEKFGIAAGVLAGIAAGVAIGLANGLVIAKLGVNPFITTLGTMVLMRGARLSDHRGAPVGDDGMPRPSSPSAPNACSASLSRLGAGDPARRAVLRDAHDALWAAHLRHRRQPRGGLSVRRAGRTHRCFDLCMVWRACGRGRRHARGAAAIRPARPPVNSTS